MASSSWRGTPSLRTIKTSSGAPSALATSYATGTPPRGSASTSRSGRPAYPMNIVANVRPASARSRKYIRCSAADAVPTSCASAAGTTPRHILHSVLVTIGSVVRVVNVPPTPLEVMGLPHAGPGRRGSAACEWLRHLRRLVSLAEYAHSQRHQSLRHHREPPSLVARRHTHR